MEILLTGFRGTSAEPLVKRADYKSLILPSDKVIDSRILLEEADQGTYNYIVSFGQKPNIRDKVYLETTARQGNASIVTDFDYVKLKCGLESENLTIRISENAGTSFCNELYWNGLNHIYGKGLAVKMIFVHIPFLKNITDSGAFFKGILRAVENL